jgi:hypothetical protein
MAAKKEQQAMAQEETKAPAPKDAAPAQEESVAPEPQESLGVADGGVAAEASDPPLERIEDLAEANRVPGWQSAALHKLMGWEPGKRVSAAEYKTGLARLKNRRIGG